MWLQRRSSTSSVDRGLGRSKIVAISVGCTISGLLILWVLARFIWCRVRQSKTETSPNFGSFVIGPDDSHGEVPDPMPGIGSWMNEVAINDTDEDSGRYHPFRNEGPLRLLPEEASTTQPSPNDQQTINPWLVEHEPNPVIFPHLNRKPRAIPLMSPRHPTSVQKELLCPSV